MGLSRKQRKELKKLRKSASSVWGDQREVLEHASAVLRDAGRQLGDVSKQEVAPRVRGVVDDRVAPVLSSTYHAGRTVAHDVKHKVTDDLLPGVSAVVASALASLESGRDEVQKGADKLGRKASTKAGQLGKHASRTADSFNKTASKRISDASAKASKAYGSVSSKVGVKPKKSGLGFGGWTLIVLGAALVAGIAYAAWQTLRADDELWVLDESDDDTKS